MISLNIYLMRGDARICPEAFENKEAFDGRENYYDGLAVTHYRPAHDTMPDHMALVTDSEMATLQRRINAYLATCRDRRLKECGDEETLARRLTHPDWRKTS